MAVPRSIGHQLAGVLVCLLCLIQLPAGARPPQSDRAETERQAGLALLGEGRFADAVEAYERALELDPDAERTYLELADIYLERALPNQAEQVLLSARTRFPDSRSPNYNLLFHDLAELQVRLGRIVKAAEAMQEASRVTGPVPADVVYKRIGDFSTDLLRFDEARAAYEKALEIDPSDAEVKVAMGNFYLRTDDLDSAMGMFEGLVRSGWDGTSVRHGIAEVHWRRGELGEAVLEANRVLARVPDDRGALYIRGSALVRLGDRDAGVKSLEEYRRLQGIAESEAHRARDIQTFRSGSMDFVLRREYDQAIELLRRGIDAYPLAEELYLALGQTQGEAGRHAEAVATFREWLDLGLDNADVAYDYLLRESRLLDAEPEADPN